MAPPLKWVPFINYLILVSRGFLPSIQIRNLNISLNKTGDMVRFSIYLECERNTQEREAL